MYKIIQQIQSEEGKKAESRKTRVADLSGNILGASEWQRAHLGFRSDRVLVPQHPVNPRY